MTADLERLRNVRHYGAPGFAEAIRTLLPRGSIWNTQATRPIQLCQPSGIASVQALGATSICKYVQASGGIITDVGPKRIHVFNTNGTFTLLNDTITARVLIVGGGGGGGEYAGHGGNGGAVVEYLAQTLYPGTHAIYVGAGGAGAVPSGAPQTGQPGGTSALMPWTAAGGAGGVGGNPSLGGDGAGGNHSGVNGGAGLSKDITGTSLFYAGGGGGAVASGAGGVGGSGVGGNGAVYTPRLDATVGMANRGGGGGGDYLQRVPAAGGSGVVIISYDRMIP